MPVAGCFAAYPQDVVYCAMETMVERFTEGLAAEYADRGINCTVSIPGFTDTEIYDSSGFADYVRSKRSYRLAMMRPETVASQAYAAVMSGRRQIVHSVHHKAMAAALLHLPSRPAGRWPSERAATSGQVQADHLEVGEVPLQVSGQVLLQLGPAVRTE